MSGPALIFDTETTGLGDGREIVEAAWLRPALVDDMAGPSDAIPRPLQGPVWSQRYRPEGRVEYGAMAVHGILPFELERCPPSSDFELPADIEYLVGHNIDFDWQAIGRPDVKRICTDAMARWIWTDADSYSQSALLYMLLGPTVETRELLSGAHGALTDVHNNSRLLDAILEARPEFRTWSALYAFSEACRIPRVLPFGKWKGSPLADVVSDDPGYVNWMLRQDWLDPYVREGLELALNPPEPETAEAMADDDIPF